MGISSNNNNRLLSEINVTPFVDVMLVLLVIFMITAPILYQGVDVSLPKTSSVPIPSQSQKNIIVTVNKEGKIYIEKEELTLRELKARVKTLVRASGKQPGEQEIYLGADKEVPYGIVMEVMSKIRSGGIEKIGLITEPLGDK